ncbi:hypothetical protein HQ531_11400 [bacterium]|nr:hypothetical protein [bacterium]
MGALIIPLRIIHIFCGVFWVGFAFANIVFLQPAVKATGAEGQKFMQHLSFNTQLMNSVYTAATLTMLSGLVIYWPLAGTQNFMASGYGILLTSGVTAGLIAWFIALFLIRSILNQMQVIGREIQSNEGPPTPEQGLAMQTLGARLGLTGKVALAFMGIALLGMSIARYSPF